MRKPGLGIVLLCSTLALGSQIRRNTVRDPHMPAINIQSDNVTREGTIDHYRGHV
jgi:hypothetical protein